MPMPEVRTGLRTTKRPCTICRRWFQPDARIGSRQRACNTPECGAALRKKTQAEWRNRNPDYAAAWRLDQRAKQQVPPPKPLRIPAPLDKLPWDVAKDEFTPYCIDFIGVALALILRATKDEIKAYLLDPKRLSGT